MAVALSERMHVAPEHRGIISERLARFPLRFGQHIPIKVLTNEKIASWNLKAGSTPIDETYLRERVGIERRHIATEIDFDPQHETATLGMARRAMRQLLPNLDQAIEAIFFSTSYPTGENNALALMRSEKLSSVDFALDIHAACTGIPIAYAYIKDNESTFLGKEILFVASEHYSPTLADMRTEQDKDPSNSQDIFSDGAFVKSGVYGRDIRVRGYTSHKFTEEESSGLCMPIDYNLVRHPALVVPVPSAEKGKFYMVGKQVLRASKKIAEIITQAMEIANLSPDDIDAIVPHQPSKIMLDHIKSKLPPALQEKLVYDLLDGNFSSASTIKAKRKAVAKGLIRPGSTIIDVGFGAGMTVVAAVLQFGDARQSRRYLRAA